MVTLQVVVPRELLTICVISCVSWSLLPGPATPTPQHEAGQCPTGSPNPRPRARLAPD